MSQTQEMAQFTLQLVSSASIRADDQTIQNIIAVKGWLGAIATGALVVAPAAKPVDAAPAVDPSAVTE